MRSLNEETLKAALDGMENLMFFYYEAGSLCEESERMMTTSRHWFDNGVFVAFVRDVNGSRVEIGDKFRKRLMFKGAMKGGALIYEEAPARSGRHDGNVRELIKDELLDRYGCVGYVRGICDATETNGWMPRIEKDKKRSWIRV